MNKDNAAGFGIGLAVGAVIGLAIGVLFAPKSGEETREAIRERAEETRELIKDKARALAAKMKRGEEEA